MTNSIAIAREQEIFAVAETTAGTLVKPGAANYIIGAGYAKIGQQPSFSNSKEIVNSRDIIDQFQDRFGAGEFELPTYVRPSGAAGTAPMGAILYTTLFGTETVTGSTSVAYSQALERDTLSLWVKKDHTVFWARGCAVESLKVALQTEGAVEAMFAGRFMEMGWIGTDDVAATEPLAETEILVTDAKKFIISGTTQCLVEFEKADGTVYDNSSSGYAITAVNYSTNVVTVNPGLEAEVASGSIIRAYLPTGTVSGAPIEARNSVAKIGAVSTPVNTFEYEINDPVNFLENEITTTDFPESRVDSERDIKGSFGVYFRRDDLDYFYDGRDGNEVDLSMVCGETAGYIMTINTPQTNLNIPAAEEADETVEIKMEFQCLGSSGEDSATITFT